MIIIGGNDFKVDHILEDRSDPDRIVRLYSSDGDARRGLLLTNGTQKTRVLMEPDTSYKLLQMLLACRLSEMGAQGECIEFYAFDDTGREFRLEVFMPIKEVVDAGASDASQQ